ncbi:hypothetical protein Hanom_Chr15g01410161 [Helianthus anomalus]
MIINFFGCAYVVRIKNTRIGTLSLFIANSPCDQINMFLQYRTLQNLFLSYVMGI